MKIPKTMRAMVLEESGKPLKEKEVPVPRPGGSDQGPPEVLDAAIVYRPRRTPRPRRFEGGGEE